MDILSGGTLVCRGSSGGFLLHGRISMFRHRHTLGLVVLVAAAFYSSSAEAQGFGGGGSGVGRAGRFGGMGGVFGGLGIINLVALAPVQKEIGLEADAAENVAKLAGEMYQEFQAESQKAGIGFAAFGQLQDLSPEEREAKMKEMSEKRMAITKGLTEKYLPKVKENLSASQFERVQQISWQLSGTQSLTDPDVSKALEISKEQREKMAGINQEFGAKQRELFGGGPAFGGGGAPPGPEVMRERMQKMQDLNKDRDAKVAAVLSKDQQDKYAALLGKPFDRSQLDYRSQFGFGGGGGFGGGRPGASPGGRGAAGRPSGGPAGQPEKKDDKK
jgi:hypothetical protein